MNRVYITGKLVRDPEVRTTSNGHTVANFTVANNQFWTSNGEKKQKATFVDVKAWNWLGSDCGNLRKGDSVVVEGSLDQDNWQTPNGEKRTKLYINATDCKIAEKPRQHADDWSRAPAPHAVPDDQPVNDEDIPF